MDYKRIIAAAEESVYARYREQLSVIVDDADIDDNVKNAILGSLGLLTEHLIETMSTALEQILSQQG